MSSKRDFQKSRVYRWEKLFFANQYNEKATISDLKRMSNAIMAHYDCKDVDVAVNYRFRGKVAGRASLVRGIQIKPGQLYRWVLCHEAAHIVAMQKWIDDGHGKQFLAIYNDILNKFLGIPLKQIHFAQKKSNLWFDYYIRINQKQIELV